MIQQYVLLRKENDLLNSLVGQSFNQKSKFEAARILDEIHSKAQSRMISKKALCYVTDKNEILGVGGSTLMKNKKTGEIVSNLILDNFGIWLAGIFHINIGSNKSVILKDRTGVNETLLVIANSTTVFNFRTSGGARGVLIQVGSGSTPPARTDFDIETAFATAPESINFTGVSDPVYSSALGNFKFLAAITAGGSGTINESILLSFWQNTANVAKSFVHFRDIISPGQAFVPGQSIALEYTVQL